MPNFPFHGCPLGRPLLILATVTIICCISKHTTDITAHLWQRPKHLDELKLTRFHGSYASRVNDQAGTSKLGYTTSFSRSGKGIDFFECTRIYLLCLRSFLV
jgi:hypothetical protein